MKKENHWSKLFSTKAKFVYAEIAIPVGQHSLLTFFKVSIMQEFSCS